EVRRGGTRTAVALIAEDDRPRLVHGAAQPDVGLEADGHARALSGAEGDRMVEALLELGPAPERPVLEVDSAVGGREWRHEDAQHDNRHRHDRARLPEVEAGVRAELDPAANRRVDGPLVAVPEQ